MKFRSTVCECEALASLRHVYLGSFFLDPEEIKTLSLGDIWTLAKEQGSPELISDYWRTKGLLIKVHWGCRDSNPNANQSIKLLL